MIAAPCAPGQEFEHRQQQMRFAVEGISSRQSPGGKPPLPTSSPGGQRNAAASAGQEEGLRQAAADAEEAAESMRLQLAEAREQQQHALMQLEEVQVGHSAQFPVPCLNTLGLAVLSAVITQLKQKH